MKSSLLPLISPAPAAKSFSMRREHPTRMRILSGGPTESARSRRISPTARKAFRMRRYKIRVSNSFGMRTYGAKDLKPCGINRCTKTGGWGVSDCLSRPNSLPWLLCLPAFVPWVFLCVRRLPRFARGASAVASFPSRMRSHAIIPRNLMET